MNGWGRLALVGVVGAVTALSACTTDAQGRDGAPPDGLSGSLTVYAAASLTASFTEIAVAFAERHPAVAVAPVVFAGSPALVAQIEQGAPADVFASADERTMRAAADAGIIAGTPETFATNTLVIAVPTGDPGGVTELADLADPALRVVICDPVVPCGEASRRLLDVAGVRVSPLSYEQSVTAVLTKVRSGDADAGLVYRTDAADVDGVEAIVPAGAADVVNRYLIAPVVAEPDDVAVAFVAFVTGADGQKILAEHGFGAP